MESNRLELYSPLPPSDCVARLSNAIDQEGFIGLSFTGSHPAIGKIDGANFRIRKRINYRNSFQVILTGSMQPHGAGTLIVGEFGMHRFVRVFMQIWFCVAAVLGAIAFEIALFTFFFGSAAHRGGAWIGVTTPVLLFGLGIVLVRVGEYCARDEARFLTGFLRETLQVTDGPRETQ